jgi:hypothetical protein
VLRAALAKKMRALRNANVSANEYVCCFSHCGCCLLFRFANLCGTFISFVKF